MKECLLLPGVAQCVLIEFHCDIFRNQFGEVFVGFCNAKYCGYCLTVDFLFFVRRRGGFNRTFKLRIGLNC